MIEFILKYLYHFGSSSELAEGGSLYDFLHDHEKHCKPTQEESLQWTNEIAQGKFTLSSIKIHELNIYSFSARNELFASAEDYSQRSKVTQWYALKVVGKQCDACTLT